MSYDDDVKSLDALRMDLKAKFNLTVQNFGPDYSGPAGKRAYFTVGSETTKDTLDALPKSTNEWSEITYHVSATAGDGIIGGAARVSINPDCGQPGHQCGCGTPKP